ncbi:MAG TPA: hypothetical protein VEI97_17480 [bacterium]|nr:hypothetical protein [bacterium]
MIPPCRRLLLVAAGEAGVEEAVAVAATGAVEAGVEEMAEVVTAAAEPTPAVPPSPRPSRRALRQSRGSVRC